MTMPDRIWADAPGVFDDCDIWRGEQVEGATEYIRADLHEAALTQSQAETAAAYATATHTLDKWAVNLRDMNFPETAPIVDQCSAMVRALVTPDQRAALDVVRAEARAEGMREAAEIAHDHTPEKYSGASLASHVTGRNIKAAILAAISKETE